MERTQKNSAPDTRLLLLTSDHWRHHLTADVLARNFNLVGIVSERRRRLQEGMTKEEDRIIKEYDEECAKKEEAYFGHAKEFPLAEDKVLRVSYGAGSGDKAYGWINERQPDYVALFSSSIIRGPLLDDYEGRMINLHLGLTPYYRGAANAFWPLVNGEPECLGATVHLVGSGLDRGDVLGQARPPNLSEDDGPRDASNKNVLSGIDLLVRCIRGYAWGTIAPVGQRLDIGREHRHRDYHAGAILAMKEKFAKGMMREYLKNKEARDRAKPIVD